MRPIQHHTSNAVEVCQDTRNGDYRPAVPITRVLQDGRHEVWTFWKPDAEELAAFNAGKCVVLGVWGQTMPPVFVAVDVEF